MYQLHSTRCSAIADGLYNVLY